MTTRRDAVVVLARGSGRRMGGPKFGLKLPGEDRTFLERIVDLYDGRGWPVTVVAGPGQGEACRALCANPGVRVVEGPEGGDTALTMVTAWRADATVFAPPTHYWAHPVDLPLVEGTTLTRLVDLSAGHPGAVLRPVFEGTIGHPVVLPRGLLEGLAADDHFHEGALKEYLDRVCGPGGAWERFLEETSDPGVVHDFDDPGELQSWHGPEGDDDDVDG